MGSDWIAQAATTLIAACGVIATTWTARRTIHSQAKLAESNLLFEQEQQRKRDLRQLYADFLNAEISFLPYAIMRANDEPGLDWAEYTASKGRLNSLMAQITIAASVEVALQAEELVVAIQHITDSGPDQDEVIDQTKKARIKLLSAMRKDLG
jgi:hypothetical protein